MSAQDLDTEMEAARAAAEAADRGDNAPAQDTLPAAATAPASASPEQTETPADQGEAQTEQKPEPSKETKPAPTEKPEGQKPESAFTKAQKEEGRRTKTWTEINAEKERQTAERQQLAEERNRLAAERQQFEAERRKPAAEKPKYSAEEYEAAAADFEKQGKYDLAEEARAAAKQAREASAAPAKPAAPAAPAATPMNQEQFMGAWRSNLDMLSKAEPDLGNPQSELGKTTAEMLRTYPLLSTYPTGIRDAVGAAKLTIQARRVPGLEKKLAAAEAELGRLNSTNSLRASPPGRPPAPAAKIEDMPLDEAEAAARAAAIEAD